MAEGVEWCTAIPMRSPTGGYRLSKEAIILYGMRTSQCWAPGIRINCTAPGVTETPILDQLRSAYGPGVSGRLPAPLGRVSEPEEQAAALVFLNSEAAGYITGQVIWVDGGRSLSGSRRIGRPR